MRLYSITEWILEAPRRARYLQVAIQVGELEGRPIVKVMILGLN